MTSRYIAGLYFIILFTFSLFETRVFNFMSLNLFLAYIPFELCLLLRLFKPRKNYEWPLFIVFGLIFILLVPNTFYMLTDLIHLNQFTFDFYVRLNIMEWLYFTYILLGVFLAMYCMILIFINIMHFTTKVWLNRTLIIVLMFLNGLGIYMGRFLRFHTVHLITEPFTIIHQVITSLNTQAITFILLMVLLQTVIIIFVKGVRVAK
ncbi:DUF1361 domain-containing protein [Staphylococcus borealis]|uniref:DUF1361 domain-containing protein n=1 Tax=Staphylococcus borealis TaxID=2742203 RepID=UPI0025A12147|nr:DUF1361 domain-containing protein [Staphylococcus borealis]MDM7863889.1 DUF1361 domain-containing protein [Staphylococcus borealis]